MKYISILVYSASLALAVCLLASIPVWGTPSNHFIHISEKMNLSRNDIKFVVEGLGGQLRHCLSETEFIIWLPEKSSNAKFIFRQLGGAYVEDFQRRISFDHNECPPVNYIYSFLAVPIYRLLLFRFLNQLYLIVVLMSIFCECCDLPCDLTDSNPSRSGHNFRQPKTNT